MDKHYDVTYIRATMDRMLTVRMAMCRARRSTKSVSISDDFGDMLEWIDMSLEILKTVLEDNQNDTYRNTLTDYQETLSSMEAYMEAYVQHV